MSKILYPIPVPGNTDYPVVEGISRRTTPQLAINYYLHLPNNPQSLLHKLAQLLRSITRIALIGTLSRCSKVALIRVGGVEVILDLHRVNNFVDTVEPTNVIFIA